MYHLEYKFEHCQTFCFKRTLILLVLMILLESAGLINRGKKGGRTGEHRERSNKTFFISLLHFSLTLVMLKMKLYKNLLF